MQVLSWNYNSEKGVIELIVEKDEKSAETVVYELAESQLLEMADIIPALSEKKKLIDMINLIYKIEEEECLTVEALSAKIDELEEEHRKIREKLNNDKKTLSKEQIMALTAQSNDLKSVKALCVSDKRHLIKLLQMKASQKRAELAKMIALGQ